MRPPTQGNRHRIRTDNTRPLPITKPLASDYCNRVIFMKKNLYPVFALVILAAAFLSAGCNPGNGVAGGGDPTADFLNEIEILRMKMGECAPGAEFIEFQRSGNSLPVLDGLQAEMAEELHNLIKFANSAQNCDEFFLALNSELPVETCDTAGRTCKDNLLEICMPTGQDNKLIVVDCESMELACLEGECTLGLCETDKCDDDTLVNCDDMNIRHDFRCGSLDLSCGYGGAGFQCIGKGEQCSSTSLAPSCAKNVLTWCLGGRIATLDCAAITDGRRECNQSWLDNNIDATAEELVSRYLGNVCSQKYAECSDGVSTCSEWDEARFCRDGIYEDIWCEGYSFSECTPPGGGQETALCTGFIAVETN